MTINRMTQSFDYSDIMTSLQTFMSQQLGFRDVNWDGSVAKTILRVLAYNAQQQQAGNNFLFNEMDLQSATIPRNAKAISSVLGYVPRGGRAARYFADIVVKPVAGATTTPRLVLDRKAKFFTNKEGVSLYFSPAQEYEATLDTEAGNYVFKGVELVQGRWVSQSYVVQSDFATESYQVPFDDVDTDFVKVGTIPNSTSSDITNFKKFETVYDLGKDKNVFYLDADKTGRYSVEFGDNKISRRPEFGSIVVIEALVTEGSAGNGAKLVESISSVGGHYGVSVYPTQQFSYGGADADSVDTIKRVAPLMFSSQGNAVTSNDYIAMTLSNFPEAETVISWGGEENNPPMFGYQFVAVKPKSADALDAVQKQQLKEILEARCVSSITPIIVDAEYTRIVIRGDVIYSQNSTVLSDQSMKVKLTNAIYDWGKSNLEFFGSDFIYSNLISFVHGVDKSVRGMTLYVDYVKNFTPIIGAANNYVFEYGQSIRPGSVLFTGFTTPAPSDIIGWAQELFDSNGVLYTRYINRDDTTGGERVSNIPVGTVNYATGSIQLNKFLALGVDDSEAGIRIKVTPGNQDPSFYGSKRSILAVDSVDINIRTRELMYEG